MNEYIESSHTYKIDGEIIPGVTEIIRAAGLYNESFFSEESRNRGKYIHTACLYHLQDDLDDSTIPQEFKGYIEAFKKFMAEAECQPFYEHCEKPLFHQTLRYGGTPDIPCNLNGYPAIIDIKTGAEIDSTGVQLAGYEQLLTQRDHSPMYNKFGLYIRGDGTYRLIPYRDRNDIKIFNAALSLWHWSNERGLL